MTGDEDMWPIFRLVLALLKACVDQRLLFGIMDLNYFNNLVKLLGRYVKLPQLRRELSDPPADVWPTQAGPGDGVSTVVSPHESS